MNQNLLPAEFANQICNLQLRIPSEHDFCRGIILEIILLCDAEHIAILRIVSIHGPITQLGIVLRGEVVKGRRSNRQTHTERRILDRTDDDTCRHVETGTLNVTIVAIGDHAGINDRTIFIQTIQTLCILAIALVVHILQADGDTPVQTVVLTAADAEVEVVDPATMCPIKVVHVGIVVIHIGSLIIDTSHIETIHVQVVKLVVGIGPVSVRSPAHKTTTFIVI